MIHRVLNLFHQKKTISEMTRRALRVKYSGSMLGIWWAVFTPLVLALSINLVFTKVFKVNIAHYTLFILSGIFPWTFFSQSLFESAHSFIANASIMKQAPIPKEMVPISTSLTNFVIFLIGLVILLPLFIIANATVLKVLPFVLILLLEYLLFIVGIGLIVATLNVFYRDVVHFLSIAILIWFWGTPIFYSVAMVPAGYRWLCFLNPLTYYVNAFRAILYNARVPFSELLAGAAIGIVFFTAGYLFFVKLDKELAKRI